MRSWLAVLLLVFAVPAFAVEPDEILDDPVLEARARDLSAEIRCVVCQNESIDSSSAGIARDLRILLRERLVAGDSDAEVKDFLVARYGDYVLLRPPVKPATYLLWFGPSGSSCSSSPCAVAAARRCRCRSVRPSRPVCSA
jgi:cytochrome c-type biogenesis protein CcmH